MGTETAFKDPPTPRTVTTLRSPHRTFPPPVLSTRYTDSTGVLTLGGVNSVSPVYSPAHTHSLSSPTPVTPLSLSLSLVESFHLEY